MKKLLILLTLLAMGSVAGYFYWKRQARLIESQIVSAIADFNAEVKHDTGMVPLEYKSIRFSGFPFSITLKLTDPLLRLPLSKWVAQPNPAMNWVEEHRFTGDLTLSADWKVTRYTLRLPTQHQSRTLLNGTAVFPRSGSAEWPIECKLALNLREAWEHLWRPVEMLRLATENLALIRSLRCQTGNYTSTQGDTPMQSLSRASFEIEGSRESDNALQLALTLNADRLHIHPAADAHTRAMLVALPSLALPPRESIIRLENLAPLGEQNLSVNAVYTQTAQDAHLKLEKLSLSNALLTAEMQGEWQKKGTQHHVTLTHEGSVTPAGEKLLEQEVLAWLARQPHRIGYSGFVLDTLRLPVNALPALATDLTPKLAALSPYSLKVEAEYESAQRALDVKTFDLKQKSWNLSISGKGSYSPMQLLPSFDATVHIPQGDTFYAQAANRLIKMEKWRQQQTPRPPLLITNDFMQDLKRLVDALARGKQENTAAEVKSLGELRLHGEMKNMLPHPHHPTSLA